MVTYCTVADVSDFLRVPITATTTPNKAQVEKIILRKEEELDRRLGHHYGGVITSGLEVHDLPLLYSYGWGSPIFLKHRQIADFNSSLGDKIEVWNGESYTDQTGDTSSHNLEGEYGKLYFRGYIFSIMRKNRIRVKYRYGNPTVPYDIQDACIKLVSIDLINSSFRMDILPVGSNGVDVSASKSDWRADIENCIDNRQEIFFIP
tara:strand:+ start:159 stop:773 length:615 start_codon:yes stop_codon:yes gene_type:complete